MAFVLKPLKSIRNHWKKSVLGTVAIIYGQHYIREKLELEDVMRVYCERAAQVGAQKLPIPNRNPRSITVILNPNANKRKASTEFEKYCAPLLHLAGISVNLLQTESEGHAKTMRLNQTEDAIIVAGGDGTLSEVLTGLLRYSKKVPPLGILPLGRHNSLAERLFCACPTNQVGKVRRLADATMAIIDEMTRTVDVMRIDTLDDDYESVYAVSAVKWGAYRDVECRRDKYWYCGKFREYAAYIFNGYKTNLTWQCEVPDTTKWYQKLIGRPQPDRGFYVNNPNCAQNQQKSVYTIDFTIQPGQNSENTPSLQVALGPRNVTYLNFIRDGFGSAKGRQRQINEVLEARQIELRPKSYVENPYFSIDNEDFTLRPVRITLLPKLINVYTPKINS